MIGPLLEEKGPCCLLNSALLVLKLTTIIEAEKSQLH
jgi:hypothetical protein